MSDTSEPRMSLEEEYKARGGTPGDGGQVTSSPEPDTHEERVAILNERLEECHAAALVAARIERSPAADGGYANVTVAAIADSDRHPLEAHHSKSYISEGLASILVRHNGLLGSVYWLIRARREEGGRGDRLARFWSFATGEYIPPVIGAVSFIVGLMALGLAASFIFDPDLLLAGEAVFAEPVAWKVAVAAVDTVLGLLLISIGIGSAARRLNEGPRV